MTRGRRARLASWRLLIELAGEGDKTAIAELRQVRREAAAVLPKPAKREREAPELGAAVVRFTNALVTRAEAGDLEAVIELRRVRRESAVALRRAMLASRQFYSLEAIAHELGVTKQAVEKATREKAGA